MKLERRSTFGWGASGASYARPREGLVIHYDSIDQGLAERSHTACREYWKRTRRFHMGSARGWADIGYSYAACPHGIVLEGRGLDRQQAAQPGGNSTWYSCTLMGGPSEQPTAAQIEAVRELRAYLMGRGVAGAVKGHRDFISTSCPGDRAYRLVRDGTFARAPEGEDDMPTAKEIATAVLELDGLIEVPGASAKNPTWKLKSVLTETLARIDKVQATVDAQGAAIRELAVALAARDEAVDVDALVARITEQIEKVTVRLDVADDESPEG